MSGGDAAEGKKDTVKKIETEDHRRVVAAERISVEIANLGYLPGHPGRDITEMPEPGEERRAAVEWWLSEHPEVIVGAPEDQQDARRWWTTTHDHQIPLRSEPSWLTVLNVSVLTDWGTYDYQPLTLDEARGLYAEYEYGPQMVQSAVGHSATAAILHDLIGESAGLLNRVEYRQAPGQKALVFKLRGRAPEGKILSREEVEAIGYDFGLLTRIS